MKTTFIEKKERKWSTNTYWRNDDQKTSVLHYLLDREGRLWVTNRENRETS